MMTGCAIRIAMHWSCFWFLAIAVSYNDWQVVYAHVLLSWVRLLAVWLLVSQFGQVVHTRASVTKQYILVLFKD